MLSNQVQGGREGWRPLSWLPNKNGFHFIGRRPDGTYAKCKVVRQENGIHWIEGEAKYAELEAWKAA